MLEVRTLSDIPNVSDQLSTFTDGLKLKRFSEKKDTTIVPTGFPGFNRATRVGGVSAPAVMLLHGPSKGGKTALANGLVIDFQRHGYLTAFIDAEHTLDKPWAISCGVNPELLVYDTPTSYEETVKTVDTLITNFREGRDSGAIHPNTACLVVVDSISKLIPENELKKLAKDDRMYPLRAMMNTAWLDKLNVTIGDLPILFCMIAHEKIKMNAMPFEKQWKVKGGDALIYDSSFQVRVKAKKAIKEGSDPNKIQVGKLHHCVMEKNKVGIDGEQFYFVMSNGKGDCPIGFDKVKEVLEECKLRGKDSPCIRGAMAKWTWDGLEGGEIRGDKKLENYLRTHPESLTQLILELNQQAGSVRVVEYSPEEGMG